MRSKMKSKTKVRANPKAKRKPKVRIKLKSSEKTKLEKMLKKGVNQSRVLTRARVLLLSHQGKGSTEVCEILGVRTLGTIQNIKEGYLKGGLGRALYDAPRPGKPPKFTGKQRTKITSLACTKAPEGYGRWSLQMLSDKLVELNVVDSISHTHVGRILKKTKSNLI